VSSFVAWRHRIWTFTISSDLIQRTIWSVSRAWCVSYIRRKPQVSEDVRFAPQTPVGSDTPSISCRDLRVQWYHDATERSVNRPSLEPYRMNMKTKGRRPADHAATAASYRIVIYYVAGSFPLRLVAPFGLPLHSGVPNGTPEPSETFPFLRVHLDCQGVTWQTPVH